MAEVLAEPNMQFLLDFNIQDLVERTEHAGNCVIKAVPPFPVRDGNTQDLAAKRAKARGKEKEKDAERVKRDEKRHNAARSPKIKGNKTAGPKEIPSKRPFSGQLTIRSPHRQMKQMASTYNGNARLRNSDDFVQNSAPNRPLVWGHVDNRPIYAPAISNDLRQLLMAHVPSTYIPINQSFSMPLHSVVRDSQHQSNTQHQQCNTSTEEYFFEKMSPPDAPTVGPAEESHVSGLAQQLSQPPPEPPRRFGFWW
uniref:Uncharacterized protein n=1 Tax=Eutreptiella gymnastica TaxID=73025 RepID=A0A7S1I994_9EUGL